MIKSEKKRIKCSIFGRERVSEAIALIEAVLVCLVGGALGVTLSLMIAFILQLFLPGWEIGFSPLALVTAFLCSTLTGVLFGWLPARNAARLDPVDALARE